MDVLILKQQILDLFSYKNYFCSFQCFCNYNVNAFIYIQICKHL